MPCPIVTRLSNPVEIISLELVSEFLGFDSDADAAQDMVLPVLVQAATEQGEQLTGAVWGAATYRVDYPHGARAGTSFALPLSPVLAVDSVTAVGADGTETPVPPDAYWFIPSAIDLGRPWAVVYPAAGWSSDAVGVSVICTAGWDVATLPHALRGWLLNRVATLYDTRTDLMDGARDVQSAPRAHVTGLLDRWTVTGGADVA